MSFFQIASVFSCPQCSVMFQACLAVSSLVKMCEQNFEIAINDDSTMKTHVETRNNTCGSVKLQASFVHSFMRMSSCSVCWIGLGPPPVCSGRLLRVDCSVPPPVYLIKMGATR